MPEGGRRTAWTRVARSRADAIASRLSAPAAGAAAAAWTFVIGLLAIGIAVITAWVAGAGPGEVIPALKVAGFVWFGAHHVAIGVGDGAVSFLPLGLAVVPGVLLWRAGRWAVRRSGACRWREVRSATLFAAGVYATLGLVLASATTLPGVGVSAFRASVGTGIFAFLAFGAGAVAEAGFGSELLRRLAPALRRRVRAATVVLAALVTGALALTTVSLVIHFPLGVELSGALGSGPVSGIMILFVCASYLPNVVVWAVAYVAGVGFALGDGTSIGPMGVEAGAVPALPFFAAIPGSGGMWGAVVLLIPLAAGALGARAVNPAAPARFRSAETWRDRLWLAGLVGGQIAVLSWLAGGSLGDGRMSNLGPNPLLVAAALVGLTIGGATLGDLGRSASRRIRRGPQLAVDLRETEAADAGDAAQSARPNIAGRGFRSR